MADERQNQYHEDEIDLMQVFSVLWRRKWLIICIVAVCVIIGLAWSITHSKSYIQSLIQLNFSGIDKHIYPDGTTFEMHDLVAQDILSTAADAIDDPENRQLFISNPRKFIFVNPFIPVEVKEKIKEMQRDKKTYVYMPTQYYLQFVQPRDGMFSIEEEKHLLHSIIRAYENKFMKKYVEQKLLPVNLSPEVLNGYDYMEAVDVLKSYLSNYSSYLNNTIKTAGLYRSPTSGQSFVEILNSLEHIRKIDLYEMESILNVSLKTKQKDLVINKYQYKIKTIEKEMQKKEEESKIAKALLENVWVQENGRGSLAVRSENQPTPQILLDSSVLEKLSGKDYKAVLLQRALEAEVAANSLKVDKKFLEDDLAIIVNEENKGIDQNISNGLIVSSIESIRKDIIELGKKANELNSEFLKGKYCSIIKVLNDSESFTQYDKDPKLVVAMAFIISLILGIFLAFMIECISNHRKKTS